MCGLLLADCHFYNLGTRITERATEHEVVIIDAGNGGLVDKVPRKSQVNACVLTLWKWVEKEIKAPYANVRQLLQ